MVCSAPSGSSEFSASSSLQTCRRRGRARGGGRVRRSAAGDSRLPRWSGAPAALQRRRGSARGPGEHGRSQAAVMCGCMPCTLGSPPALCGAGHAGSSSACTCSSRAGQGTGTPARPGRRARKSRTSTRGRGEQTDTSCAAATRKRPARPPAVRRPSRPAAHLNRQMNSGALASSYGTCMLAAAGEKEGCHAISSAYSARSSISSAAGGRRGTRAQGRE